MYEVSSKIKNSSFTRRKIMKKIVYGMLVILASVFFGGCGGSGGDKTTKVEAQSVTVPSSASEVRAAYEAAPKMLESYFYEIENLGKSSNPDTVATSSELGTHLVVTYKGVEIYNESHAWGIFMEHGFMKDGTYIIILWQHDTGDHTGISKIFINGQKKELFLQFPVNDIREIDGGWLVLLCQNGHIETGFVYANWVIFNPSTAEKRQFGDFGTIL